MDKLLLTSDFSDASRNALVYAEWLALNIQASITAVHVFPDPVVEETLGEATIGKLVKKKEKQLLQQLRKFTTPYPDSTHEKITSFEKIRSIVKRGKVIDQIINTSKEENADLIIVGTRAKHNLWEHLFGSVTTTLIKRSPTPILVVPEGVKYKKVSHIVFATEISLKEEAAYPKLNQLARKLNAKVSRIFVNVLPTEQTKHKEELIDTSWGEKESDSEHHQVFMIRERSVIEGIDYYLDKYPGEIVALYVPNRGFPENIFHRSVSKQMALNANRPILILKNG